MDSRYLYSFTWKIKNFLHSRFLISPPHHKVLPNEMDYNERGPFKLTLCSGYVRSAGLFCTLSLTAAWSAWTVIVRLPESTGKWCVQRMIKNVHISYPRDHHYFVPSKPQRWFPEIGLYGREKEMKKKKKTIQNTTWRTWVAITCIKHQISLVGKFCLVHNKPDASSWVGGDVPSAEALGEPPLGAPFPGLPPGLGMDPG